MNVLKETGYSQNMKVTLLFRGMIDSNMSKVKTSLIALTAIMATIMILGVTPAFAQTVEEIEMCYGYSTASLNPLGTTSEFLTTNEEAGIWVKVTNPSDDVVFKFYRDVDGVEKEYSQGYSRVDIIPKEGSSWGIAFASLKIDGVTPSFEPGIWTAKVFIDGNLEKIKSFNIVDYSAIASSIATFREEVAAIEAEIRAEVATIEAEKNDVVDNYDILLEDYATLVEQYEDLEDTSVSEIRLVELNNDLDDLQDEYDDLVAAQGSTRTMMYGSIVVALIAVIVAVYFGLMKK